MTKESPDDAASARKFGERSRKYLSLVLQKLQQRGQDPVAQQMGCHESTVSRLKEHLPNVCTMLEAVGLKVVPVEFECYAKADIEVMFHLAQKAMREMRGPESLLWDGQDA